jgi:hypothetical protein
MWSGLSRTLGGLALALVAMGGVAHGQYCPVGCGDQRDQLIQEYSIYGVNLTPTCSSFTQSASTNYYSFSSLNYPSRSTAPATYSWAILRSPLIKTNPNNVYGLDVWTAFYNAIAQTSGARTITSGYRCPSQNAAAGGAHQSRHMYGDATDFANLSGGQTEWNNMVTAAQEANADYIEPQTGPCKLGCVHADWRNH